ncbi:MAG TPA: caspase family protein [Bradyrhizobium sp.]|uniref:caspase family protein n=1 Tax=Bradyrhizobium sp. TaxID=376 RepID=UPI002C2BEE86|nr:caspase family protein [Bradyrhizobium sp.]HTB03414.1 caspase family protein [Bradyrhizobium sp.]
MAGRIGIISRLMVAAFLLYAGMGSMAHAEKRVALVIGNSAYRTVAVLPNPASDARLMSDTLSSLGFFVVGGGAQIDLDKAGFEAALGEFAKALNGADVALFYYAGHGVETHGLNLLVPVDVHPADEGDVFAQTIGLAGILDQMEKSGARINLLLLDACRNNPFRSQGVRSATGGLAQMQAPPGTLISFATQPRSVSLDGDDGHSPYTRALAATMQHPGFGLFKTFNEVGLAVEKATRGVQLPWVSTSPISGNFYFAGKPAPPSIETPASPAEPARLSDDALRRDLVTDCDRLAGMPYDTGHAPDVPGVEVDKINVAAAGAACSDAIAQYPDVARFAFEAGRVAMARKDYAEARRLYDKAAASGYPMAMNNIGALYEGGTGVPRNYAEAVRWYSKAAALGEPIAMVDLGWLYEHGQGVAEDLAEARRLYETAANAGVPAGMNNLGLLYLNGKGVPRDYAKARQLFEQGIALGDAANMNDLGVMYMQGSGVRRDVKTAREWYEKAAALGNPEAKQNLVGLPR